MRHNAPQVSELQRLAELCWRVRTKGLEYMEEGLRRHEQQQRAQQERYLHNLAANLGLDLTAKSRPAAA